MTPLAALISAVVYSYWTNTTFRHPVLFSAIMLTIGYSSFLLFEKDDLIFY